MKARITFVLFAAAFLFAGTVMAATPATDAEPLLEEAPQITTLEAVPAVGTPEEPLFMVTPTKCNHPEPSPNYCDRWDSSYCNYEWNCECCCVAIWTAPGAHCGNICI